MNRYTTDEKLSYRSDALILEKNEHKSKSKLVLVYIKPQNSRMEKKLVLSAEKGEMLLKEDE